MSIIDKLTKQFGKYFKDEKSASPKLVDKMVSLRNYIKNEMEYQKRTGDEYFKLEEGHIKYKQVTSISTVHYQKFATLQRILTEIEKAN